MKKDLRTDDRFKDIGKVECPELCAINGILDDISLKGCKMHFNCSVTVDMDNDYELRIKTLQNIEEGFLLIGRPKWVRDIGSSTEIGFNFLRSPDTPQFEKYIEENYVAAKDSDSSDIEKWFS